MSTRRRPAPPRREPTGLPLPWLIALAALIGCIVLAVWAVNLRGDLSDAEDRVRELTVERDGLRQAATASVYDLTPTAEGPANASGTLYLTAAGSGVLNVVNLPALGEGEAYQVWFLPPDEGEPIPGSTFPVDDRGIGFLLVAADVGAFRGVAVSVEPEGGSTVPSGPMLLTGAAAGARG